MLAAEELRRADDLVGSEQGGTHRLVAVLTGELALVAARFMQVNIRRDDGRVAVPALDGAAGALSLVLAEAPGDEGMRTVRAVDEPELAPRRMR